MNRAMSFLGLMALLMFTLVAMTWLRVCTWARKVLLAKTYADVEH